MAGHRLNEREGSVTSARDEELFLFLLPPSEPFTPESAGALATCELGLARSLLRRGKRAAFVAPRGRSKPHTVDNYYSYSSADTAPPLTRPFHALRRRFRGGPEHEVARGIERVLAALGCPAVAVSCNSALGFQTVEESCIEVCSVLWLQNPLGRGRVPGLDGTVAPDLVVANSQFTASASEGEGGWAPGSIRRLLNAVDGSMFFPREGFLDRVPGRPVRVLLLGRIDPNKGFDRALSALALVRDEGYVFEVALAGPLIAWGASAHRHLQLLRRQLAAVEGEYLGAVGRDELPALVRSYDMLIAPSISQEPFGLVVLEAMASGLAVIASNRGGLPEACGAAATLVEPDDIPGLASAIVELMATDALRTAKRASVAHARTRTWDHAAAELLDLLDDHDAARRP
jgi:glycosyltransferase involved in cell wall biosynthesis